MRAKQRTGSKVSRFSAAIFSGAMLLSSCGTTPIPDRIPIMQHLQEGTDAQKNGEITEFTRISGRLNRCIGEKTCSIPIIEGQALFNVRFMPEKDGNLSVVVDQVGDGGVSLKMEYSFSAEDRQFKTQFIEYGQWARIKSTDLEVLIKRDGLDSDPYMLLDPMDPAGP